MTTGLAILLTKRTQIYERKLKLKLIDIKWTYFCLLLENIELDYPPCLPDITCDDELDCEHIFFKSYKYNSNYLYCYLLFKNKNFI